MLKALFKLNEFLCENDIEYMVTGTMALHILGMPSSYTPNSIDIKVFSLTDEQIKNIKMLSDLTGCNYNESSESSRYSFRICSASGDILVNMFYNEKNEPSFLEESIQVWFSDSQNDKEHGFYVQKACYALSDKAKLDGPKDARYFLNLINNLTV